MPLPPNTPATNPPVVRSSSPLTTSRGVAALPLVASTFTTRLATGEDFSSVIQVLLPASQEALLQVGLMEPSLNQLVPEGLAMAAQLGQRGVVIHQEILESPTPGDFPQFSFRSPESGGVSIIGVGPDANSVCASKKCHNMWRPPLPSATTKPTPGSGYYFYEQMPDGSIQVSFFPQKQMEQRSMQLELNDAVRESYLEVSRARAMDDYIQAMQARANEAKNKARIIDMAARRSEAVTQRKTIERDLKLELERTRKARMTSSTLQALATVFTLASAMSMVTATMGTIPSPPGGQLSFENMQQLEDALNAMSAASSSNAAELQRQLNELNKRLKDINMQLLDVGTEQGMGNPVGTILL